MQLPRALNQRVEAVLIRRYVDELLAIAQQLGKVALMSEGKPELPVSGPISAGTRADVLLRLRRIEGQVRGIQRMVEENRDCRDVVVQLAAIKASVASLNTLVAETYAQECLCGGEPLDSSAVTSLLGLLKAAR